MKILAISDEVQSILNSPVIKDRFGDVDVVLSCGDLPYTYLEYIATMLPTPCLYVHGNHDHGQYMDNGRMLNEPGGWQNLDCTTVKVGDWIIGGLEGSISYRPFVKFQYTEEEFRRKVKRMMLSLLRNRVFSGRYIDILITHSPPLGIHDGKDASHRGFETLLNFMKRFRPRYLLHGHQHRVNIEQWRTKYEQTEIINIYPYRRLDLHLA